MDDVGATLIAQRRKTFAYNTLSLKSMELNQLRKPDNDVIIISDASEIDN